MALVVTSDLFRSAQYLSEHADEDYKAYCGNALLTGVGLVRLPDPPARAAEHAGDELSEAATGGTS